MDIDAARDRLPDLLVDPDEKVAALAAVVALLLAERDERHELEEAQRASYRPR